jgi:hypothetical protein
MITDEESQNFPIIIRKILTLLRTLLCFIRLLPVYSQISSRPIPPIIKFRISNPEELSEFDFEALSHRFTPVSTGKGNFTISVEFADLSIIQVRYVFLQINFFLLLI